jgi:hypothetical protein
MELRKIEAYCTVLLLSILFLVKEGNVNVKAVTM